MAIGIRNRCGKEKIYEKTVLRVVAGATLKSAKKAGNGASVMGLHQPK